MRYVSQGLQTSAQELGEVALADCVPMVTWLQTAAANGPGDCTQVAWAHDNPGYDPNAVPARPLKKLIESIGPGC